MTIYGREMEDEYLSNAADALLNECVCRHRTVRHVSSPDLGQEELCLDCVCKKFRPLLYHAVLCTKCKERPARPSAVDADYCWSCWGDEFDSGRVILHGRSA